MVLANSRPQNGGTERQDSTAQRRRAPGREQTVPPITHHARDRWAERATEAESDIKTAWTQALTVAAPARDCDRARLYAPADLVFVVRGGVVTTVCPANYDSLGTGDLAQCSECDNLDRYTAGDTVCRWCGRRSTTIQTENGIEITFEGGA